MLDHLSSSTSLHSSLLCQPFVKPGSIILPDLVQPIHFTSGLLDTGAQGSNFISRKLYNQLPPTATALSKPVDRVIRLGDSSSLLVGLEIPLTVSFLDSNGHDHVHTVWNSVLDVQSHDIIIGLIDLIGPYYNLSDDSITSSRESQPSDLVLWNPRKYAQSFRTTKLAPKLLGPYMVQNQTKNEIHCIQQHLNT